jgi:hypothetical protein
MTQDEVERQEPQVEGVFFSTKELLADIKGSLTTLVATVGTKADNTDVVALRGKVQEHDARLTAVETSSNNRKWLLAAVIIPSLSLVLAVIAVMVTNK